MREKLVGMVDKFEAWVVRWARRIVRAYVWGDSSKGWRSISE